MQQKCFLLCTEMSLYVRCQYAPPLQPLVRMHWCDAGKLAPGVLALLYAHRRNAGKLDTRAGA